ncbi:hypothetical protein [Niabella aquatica]
MNLKNSKAALVTVTVILFVFTGSCQGPKEPGTRNAPFIGKRMQLKALTVTPDVDWNIDGIPDKDIYALLEPCEKDDRLVLQSDHRVIRSSGKIKCEEDEEDFRVSGRWEYNEKKQTLILNEEDQVQEFKIVKYAAGRLTLSYRFTDTSNRLHLITAVYVFTP